MTAISAAPNEIGQYLWDLGYVSQASGGDVSRDQAGQMPLSHRIMREAVRLYQENHAFTLDAKARELLGRPLVADGDVGPATLEQIAEPRCSVPDYSREGFDLPEAANWPQECRRKLKRGRDFENLPGMTKADTDKVFWGSANIWTSAIDVEITPRPDLAKPYCDFWSTLSRLSGNILAMHWLAQNRCDVTLNGVWNNGRHWALQMAIATDVHELGHGLGLGHLTKWPSHEPIPTMYPTITSAIQGRYGWPSPADLRYCQQMGYHVEREAMPDINELLKPRPADLPEPPPLPPEDENVVDRVVTRQRLILGGRRHFLVKADREPAAGQDHVTLGSRVYFLVPETIVRV